MPHIAPHPHRVRQRRRSPGLPDSLHTLRKLRLAAVNVATAEIIFASCPKRRPTLTTHKLFREPKLNLALLSQTRTSFSHTEGCSSGFDALGPLDERSI